MLVRLYKRQINTNRQIGIMISRRLLRIKVMQVVFACFSSGERSMLFYENELNKSIEKFYELYHAFFALLIELRDFANHKIELRKGKLLASHEELNPNMRFINNRVLSDLENNGGIKKYIATNNTIWKEQPEVVKKLYNTLIESEVYIDYMQNPNDSYNNDKQVLYYIFEHILPDHDDLYQFVEDTSIYWNDDIELVLSMNIRTIQRMKQNKGANNKLFPLYKNIDDIEFVKKLFRNVIAKHERNKNIISELSYNWEPDRIALIDRVILELAITELTDFPLIPIPVTLNEYIDIAKYYSTEKSHMFVNGLLDKIVELLTASGDIKKTEIGLNNPIDNSSK